MKNIALKYFYTKLYNSGNLHKLVIPWNQIKHLDKIYKENFNNFDSFGQFESVYQTDFELLKLSKSAYLEYKKQFHLKKALQPCILTECFVAQSLANLFGLDKHIDLDADGSVPTKLTAALYAAKRYTDGSKFRYCYYNDKFDTLLFQCGASKTVDIVFTKSKTSIRVEVKEQTARLEERDVLGGYDEMGKLIITPEFKSESSKYVPYIEIFNKNKTIFDIEGHNFKIVDYLQNEEVRELIAASLDAKVIDIFVFVIDNYIVPVLPKHIMDFVSFEGSEIRSAGKNDYKIFTPIFVKNKIKSMNGEIRNDIVYLPYNANNRVMGKGKLIYTRYKIGSLLSVKLNKTNTENNTISFKFSDIKQKKPCISIHLNAKIKPNCLIEQLNEVE